MMSKNCSKHSRRLSITVCIIFISLLAACLKIQEPLHDGKAGGFYKTKVTVKGGSGNYLFTLESGSLPSGLSLEDNGTIFGSIDSGAVGVHNFKVKAVDKLLPGNWFKAEQELKISVDNNPYKWTLITHFAVDNNINYQMWPILDLYIDTLEDIKARDLANNIQIIFMMDAYNENTKYADGYYYLTGGAFRDDLVVPIEEINSGSIDDTKAFLSWAAERYPSERYMYSIFNHGSGFNDPSPDAQWFFGIGFDESSDNDRLTHDELGQATAHLKGLIGRPVDIFYPFACVMGGVELAYEVRDNADYLLSSEEDFPADIFSYQGIDAVLNAPDISPETLAMGMCDNAYQLLANRILNPRAFTMSLVDLSRIESLYEAIDDYAIEVMSDINNDQNIAAYYNQAADNSFTMHTNDNIDDFYYVDLGDYLNHVISSDGIGDEAKIKASNVVTALGQAVLYQRQNKYPRSSGLTIFHNIWGADDYYITELYREILLFGANTWTDYIDVMMTLMPE